MKKIELQRKVEIAWKKAIAKNPQLRSHGDDGWKVWNDNVYKLGQEDIARLFDVSYRTSQRWHDEYRTLRAV